MSFLDSSDASNFKMTFSVSGKGTLELSMILISSSNVMILNARLETWWGMKQCGGFFSKLDESFTTRVKLAERGLHRACVRSAPYAAETSWPHPGSPHCSTAALHHTNTDLRLVWTDHVTWILVCDWSHNCISPLSIHWATGLPSSPLMTASPGESGLGTSPAIGKCSWSTKIFTNCIRILDMACPYQLHVLFCLCKRHV